MTGAAGELQTGEGARSREAEARRPWRRAVVWLVFLGPFFFLTYNFANWAAAQRAATGAFYFGWERSIPFLPWTIAPYWSIDLLYAGSLFICRDRDELDLHGLRLATAQVISVICFLLFPLRFAFDRPPVEGVFGALFDALAAFDKLYNQAPSLHIALLIILWVRYAAHVQGVWRWLLHGWLLLIGVSVLTTWQHHVIDIPTGMLAGFLCLWIWPDAGQSPMARLRLTASPRRRAVASVYLAGGVVLAGLASTLGGLALVLWQGAVALALVAFNYGFAGASGFQKSPDGRHSLAAAVLLAPHRLGTQLNVRAWTRGDPTPSEIGGGVWLGPLPSPRGMSDWGFSALYDLTCELAIATKGAWAYRSRPWLDLIPPDGAELAAAARDIEEIRAASGSVLVACALGRSRSACAVAAWLLHTGRAASVDDAVAQVRARRPQVVFRAVHVQALKDCARLIAPTSEETS